MKNDRNHRIDYIEFTSNDIAASREFFRAAFNWKFEDYGPEYTSFHDGNLAGGFAKGNAPSAPCGLLVVLYVDDLSAAEKNVKAAGGTISKARFSFPGGSRFHFREPGGNELAAWHDS